MTPVASAGPYLGPDHTRRPPFLGFGVGFRDQHLAALLHPDAPVDWIEIISDNFLMSGGPRLAMLDRLRDRFPLVMHGVSLSIASTAPLDLDYLAALKALAARVQPRWISDHLCWTGVHGRSLHDLLPIPYTFAALDHVAARVHRVQEVLGRPLTLENVSSYVRFRHSEMPEWAFLTELTRRTGCWLLLDLGNLHVNCVNHGEDPRAYLAGLPADQIVQFHVAGHSHMGPHLIDTHDAPVSEAVWELYAGALDRFGPVSTMIERDDHDTSFETIAAEVQRSRTIARAALAATALPEQ